MKTATANSVAKVHREPNLKPPNPSSCLAFAIIGHQQRNEAVALSLYPGWQLDFLLSPQAAAAQHDGAVNLCISWCLSGGWERRVSGEGNGACPSLGSTCLHWRHRALLISVQVSKCSPGMTAWHSQHPHSVTGAGSRSHCLPLMSMSLMEMEESEGHISIQIASILSAIQPPGSGGCRFPSAAPLTHFHRFIPIAYKSPPCGSGPMTPAPLPYTNMLFIIIWLAKNKVGGGRPFFPALQITKVSLANTCCLWPRKWKLLLFKLEASSEDLMYCLQWSYLLPSNCWCLSAWTVSVQEIAIYLFWSISLGSCIVRGLKVEGETSKKKNLYSTSVIISPEASAKSHSSPSKPSSLPWQQLGHGYLETNVHLAGLLYLKLPPPLWPWTCSIGFLGWVLCRPSVFLWYSPWQDMGWQLALLSATAKEIAQHHNSAGMKDVSWAHWHLARS